MAGEEGRLPAAERMAGGCLAVRVRTLNRVVTALYDDALRPLGPRVGQWNLLVAIARMGTARPGDLCRILAPSRTLSFVRCPARNPLRLPLWEGERIVFFPP